MGSTDAFKAGSPAQPTSADMRGQDWMRPRGFWPWGTPYTAGPFYVVSRATAGPGDEERPACADTDPEAFFKERYKHRDLAYLRRLCGGCAFLGACLDEALDLGDFEGFRGGKTGEEREAIDRASRGQYRRASPTSMRGKR